jgi:hypothetical protein
MIYSIFSVLKPDWLLLFHSMKSKQKSCQNEPSAGRFDGLRTRFEYGYCIINMTNQITPLLLILH